MQDEVLLKMALWEEALIKADLPKGGFAERPILPKETDFVGKV